MAIAFDRSLCRDLTETISREWLITNGLGGYAAGTIAGVLTRMHHGLLVASPLDTTEPQLLLAKIDEEVVFDKRTYYLGTNEYRDGTLNPSGFVHLETFHLEEGFPVFTYHLGGLDGIVLEKRIWMPRGQNTTCIQYRVLPTMPGSGYIHQGATRRDTSRLIPLRGYHEASQRTLTLTLLPFSAYRPYNQPQYGNNDWHFLVNTHQHEIAAEGKEQPQITLPEGVAGCTIRAWDGAHPYSIFAVGHPGSSTTFIPTGVWYWKFLRRHDQAFGLPPTDDLYLPGVIRATLWPGEDATLTVIATAEDLSTLVFSPDQLDLSYRRNVEQQRTLLQPQRYFGEGGETAQQLRVFPITTSPDAHQQGEEYLQLLLQAADRFLLSRRLPSDSTMSFFPKETVPLIPSTYFNLEEHTRDTLIALPGLTLATGRYGEARRLLRSLARYFNQGLLPDRLPAVGHPLELSDYSSVDTTLWYFYALDHYIRVTHDYELLDELYNRLVECINQYKHGTYHGIRVDSKDGLLEASQPGKALTWMNALIDGVPVTPRAGKPVEVNALWYHALSLMHEWSQQLYTMRRINYRTAFYQEQSERCRESFQQRFWYDEGGYLYDVIDGPDGDDTSLRPNQLLALSLRHALLEGERHRAVLEHVTEHLLTPYGLRTLAPYELGYQGRLEGNQQQQLRGYHQGAIWPWLIGPYADAWLGLHGLNTSTSPALAGRYGKHDREQLRVLWQEGVQILEPFRKQFYEGMLGMIGSVFAGDDPHKSGYNPASAASIGEVLRIYNRFAQVDVVYLDPALSTA